MYTVRRVLFFIPGVAIPILSSLSFKAPTLTSTARTMMETHLYMKPAGEYHIHVHVHVYI